MRVGKAFTAFRSNLSLLAVLMLEFILLFFVGVLFTLLMQDRTSVASITFMIILQVILFILIDGFFKAGFSGMARNTLQDGSTTIREFLPNAKRYWTRFVGFYTVRMLLLMLFGIPFFLTALSPNPTSGFLSSVLLGIGMLLLFCFFFLWAPAFIIYKDVGSVEAMRRSFLWAKQKTKKTLRTGCMVFLIFLVGFGLSSLLSLPLRFATPSPTLFWIGIFVEILMYMIFASSVVIITLYVFGSFSKK